MAEQKPEITYPCQWAYRVIGMSEEPLRNTIESILVGKKYSLKASNSSSGGKYLALALELVVDSEAERLDIFDSLKASDEVKMVL